MGSITIIGGTPTTGGNTGSSSSGLQLGQAVQAGGGVGLIPLDGRVLAKSQYPDLYAALNTADSSPLMDFDVSINAINSLAQKYSVAYNATSNSYVAINLTTGAFFRSQDGGNSWVAMSSPVNQTWLTVMSNGAIFLAVGTSSTAISNDGITWSNITILPVSSTIGIASVFFSDGKFHIYGEGNRVHLTSSNGYDWVSKGIPIGTIHDVLWTGKNYVAYGRTSGSTPVTVSQVATSPDGAVWTLRTLPVVGSITSGACLGSTVMLVTAYNKVLLSTDDGVTWANTSTIPAPGCYGLTTTTTGFVAAMQSNSYKTQVYYTADGITWTQATGGISAYLYYNGNDEACTFTTNGTRWVFPIRNSNVALVTDDFDTWKVGNLPSVADWSLVIWSGTQFVMLSDTGTTSLLSSDGITWTVGGNAVPVFPRCKGAVNSAGLMVMTSYATATSCWTSPDGITWTARTLASGNWLGLAVKGTTFVVTNSAGGCASSTDGITWTARTVTTGTQVAASSTMFVTMKGGASLNNIAYSSPDGITWTARGMPSVSSDVFNQVFFNGSVFVSISNTASGGSSNTSVDGITWLQSGPLDLTGVQIRMSFNMTSANKGVMVSYVNGQMVLLENYMDPTGKKWVSRKTGLPSDVSSFGMVGKGSNGTAAVGVLGSLVQRFDNGVISWSTLPAGLDIGSGTYNKLIWTGTQFVAHTYTNNGAPFYLTSPDGLVWTKNAAPTTGYASYMNNTLMIVNAGGVYCGNSSTGWTYNAHSPALISINFTNIGYWGINNKFNVAYNGSTLAESNYESHPSYIIDGKNLIHTMVPIVGFPHENYAVNGRLVVGCYSNNIYYSEDGGNTWKFVQSSLPVTLVTYNAAQDVFVAINQSTVAKCLISKDGKNWTQTDLPASASVQGLASMGKMLIINVNTTEWYYSLNGGVNWNKLTNPNTAQTWGSAMAGSATEIVGFATAAGGKSVTRIRKLFSELTYVKVPSIPQVAGTPAWYIKAK